MRDLLVILDRKELVVRMESKAIRIDRPCGQPERIPLNMVASVIIVGSPMVSCDVWRALAEKNISAVLIPSRGRGVPAYMGTGLSATIDVRMAQHLAVHENKCSLAIGRWLLDMKMQGQESVLRKLGNGASNIEIFCEKIREHRIELQNADCRNSLMGHEGVAASEYYKGLGKMLQQKWKFSGRNRRPPRDPVNALLSLSYVMAGGGVRNVVQQNGLDPALGFLHSPQSGRESLVLDVLEPLRPEVDCFVLQLLDHAINLRHFSTNEHDGCLLNKGGRKAFFKAWASWQEWGKKKKPLTSMAADIIYELIAFFPDRRES